MSFVQVAVNVPSVAGVFDYAVPEDFQAAAGQLVTVPFGRQTTQGVILRFVDIPSVPDVKPLLSILDPLPALTQAQMDLAASLAASNLLPLAAVIDMMLPPGLGRQADMLYEQRQRPEGAPAPELSRLGVRLVRLLEERGPLRGRQIDRHVGRVQWRGEARKLLRQGMISSEPVLPAPTSRPKMVRTAQLAVPRETAEAALPSLGRTPAALERRQAALRCIMEAAGPLDVAWVYAESSCSLADLKHLEGRGLVLLGEAETWRDPLVRVETPGAAAPTLTAKQEAAWGPILAAFGELARGGAVKPFLLQGVTGSGKTELYLRAVEEAARRGRQSIVLVPEIALTPQTVRRFMDRFPGEVGLIHSRLSEGERYDTWRRARAGLLKLVVGPRSALFTPFPRPGLIVLDECHDSSYYQSEPPFYHAVSAAQTYARLTGSVCILGSATPSIVQRRLAETGESHHLLLRERIARPSGREDAADWLPPVSVVDMREELKQGNRHIFSRDLMDALRGTLERREQAILFLNRRGTATYIFCRECGHVLRCPRCDTPLTLHLDGKPTLRCHTCGYERGRPSKCPQCGGTQIREYGLGSERLESEVNAAFPGVRTLRWDWETTRRKDSHELILTQFAAHHADVLVGTQMLAKGLDLPLVTLVGIVLADVGLTLPDPFAGERVFQVLTQVAGRAGRSSLGGRVILQTFQPQNEVIQSAAGHDYEGFYRMELANRKALGYPPFGGLARLEVRHHDPARAEEQARRLAGQIQGWIESEGRRQTHILGPVPCFFTRLAGQYRWQIVVRGPDPASLLRGRVPPDVRLELEPQSLL